MARDRALVFASLALACLACWAWIAPMARDMYGGMNGAAAWMQGNPRDARYAGLLFAMWAVMMAGMMLPSAAPTILLFARVARSDPLARVSARVGSFTAGYLAAWTAFSAAATLVQYVLSRALSPMMQLRSPAASAALLLIAGAWQLTPAKRTCLDSCRNPAAFIARWYLPGNAGAFRAGTVQGAYCLGCCWALMLLLFAAGIMNPVAIAALALFVLLEKLAPVGVQGGLLSGLLLILCGAAVLLR